MKRLVILAAAALLAGCTSFGQLGLLCYIPPDHMGSCTLMPTPKAAPAAAIPAPAASGVSV